jgi:hypothetical protein
VKKYQKKMRNFARRYPVQNRGAGGRIVTSLLSATSRVVNAFVFLLGVDRTVGTSRIHRFYNCLEAAKIKGDGKAIPLQALTGPEGSKRSRLPDFKTIGT